MQASQPGKAIYSLYPVVRRFWYAKRLTRHACFYTFIEEL